MRYLLRYVVSKLFLGQQYSTYASRSNAEVDDLHSVNHFTLLKT